MSGTWWVDEQELLEEQLDVLNKDFDINLLISGPPGSGKTNLLLLRANHIHITEGTEFYIIGYTSLLTNFIRTGAQKYKFPTNKIITQMKLYETVLNDHGINVPKIAGEKFPERLDRLREGIKKLMSAKLGENCFPILFIDEAQDYGKFDLEAFFYLANKVCLSADIRQGLYINNEEIPDFVKSKCDEAIKLRFHYRTGKNILVVADKLMHGKLGHEPMLDTSQYNESDLPSTVEHYENIDIDKQIQIAADRLINQLKAYPNETLGVLAPRKEELNYIWEKLSSHPQLSDKVTNAHLDTFNTDRPIWFSTIHSAKGLEFRAVHLLSAEFVANHTKHARRLAFTAVTRAKTALVIYSHEALLPFFAAALASKAPNKIKIGQLFGKTI